MTPQDCLANMIERAKEWNEPPDDPSTALLVRATKASFTTDDIMEAVQLLYCDHAMSFMMRPLVDMLFQSIDKIAHP